MQSILISWGEICKMLTSDHHPPLSEGFNLSVSLYRWCDYPDQIQDKTDNVIVLTDTDGFPLEDNEDIGNK